MAESPFLPYRAEVRDFLLSSERPISAAVTAHNLPITQDEWEIVEFYLAEVGKILTPQGQHK